MNYSSHYEKLIEKRKISCPEGYSEDHHIIPSSIGGPDIPVNRVRLSAREHFVAHLLLVKMYPGNAKLIYAASMMSSFKKYGSKKYSWLREKHSVIVSERQNGVPRSKDTCRKCSESQKGRIFSEEHRENLKGPKSEEYREQQRKSHLDKTLSEEHRNKISESENGKIVSEETREKMRKPKSEEHKKNMRKPKSEEHRKNMRGPRK